MAKYIVYGTLFTDCSIEIDADSEKDAKEKADSMIWHEWDTEPNNLEVGFAEKIVESEVE